MWVGEKRRGWRGVQSPLSLDLLVDFFFQYVSDFVKCLHFTFTQYTSKTINFLDISVSVTNYCLSTSVYHKDANSHNCLLYSFDHPPRFKDSIPFSRFPRLPRICSDHDSFLKELDKMLSFFLFRGCHNQILTKAHAKVLFITRHTALNCQQFQHDSHRSSFTPFFLHTAIL